MANIMSMKSIRNKPSRNGFDLSFKKNFTAKAGELLPVAVKEVLPGDKMTIDLKSFTRTRPVNTAAFARIREYYDFFFVPYQLLWNRSNTVLTQMNYNQMHATALVDSATPYSGEFPYVTLSQIGDYLYNMASVATDSVKQNYFGYDRALLSAKLLEYLEYGNFEAAASGESSHDLQFDVDVNIMGLLAYQKIYSDFFRDEQWESPNPSTFNVDYMDGVNSMNVDIPISNTSPFFTDYNFFDMRYCNWQKDLYHGLLPQAQYGETAAVPLGGDASGLSLEKTSTSVAAVGSGNSYKVPFVDSSTIISSAEGNAVDGTSAYLPFANGAYGSVTIPRISSAAVDVLSDVSFSGAAGSLGNLSILALRQYEFLQKWKEIAQSADQNYKDQIQKMWNVNVSHHLSEKCTYLGGISGSLDINEVVNTNITEEYAANLAGKGVGVNNGRIEFNSDGQFGLLMCIYHAIPIVDYTVDYTNPSYMRVNAEDFANPVFDRVGMEAVSSVSIANGLQTGRPTVVPASPVNLGYAPRYVDYKTSIDLSVGAFKRDLSSWVLSYGRDDLLIDMSEASQDGSVPAPVQPESGISYAFFKINPALLDPIFPFQVDSDTNTDQFMCSCFFDWKAVRNLDVDGLPY